jgi:hypothetical protein
MNLMIKSMVLLTAISVPAVAAVTYHGAWPQTVGLVRQAAAGSTSVRAKDETRLEPFADDDLFAEFGAAAQTSHAPVGAADSVRIAQAFGPPFMFGAPPVPNGTSAPVGPHMGPHMGPQMGPPMGMGPPPPPTRAACEDRIDVETAMAAYVKAKLRLQPSQREAWQKLEAAAQSSIDKIRAACAGFPADANVAVSLPEMLDAVEADLSARAEFLRATREPLRALYAALTPEQRLAAQPFLPPPPWR